jgi:Cdc6-like AAA superfamily ATPase
LAGAYHRQMLHGRDAEQRLIESLLADARDGRSAVIVILGEPGIGKTALLQEMADSSGMAALRCTGVEANRRFLSQVCTSCSDRAYAFSGVCRSRKRLPFGPRSG